MHCHGLRSRHLSSLLLQCGPSGGRLRRGLWRGDGWIVYLFVDGLDDRWRGRSCLSRRQRGWRGRPEARANSSPSQSGWRKRGRRRCRIADNSSWPMGEASTCMKRPSSNKGKGWGLAWNLAAAALAANNSASCCSPTTGSL
jgi:hypothetical protein